jgi:hypothetical protein
MNVSARPSVHQAPDRVSLDLRSPPLMSIHVSTERVQKLK